MDWSFSMLQLQTLSLEMLTLYTTTQIWEGERKMIKVDQKIQKSWTITVTLLI